MVCVFKKKTKNASTLSINHDIIKHLLFKGSRKKVFFSGQSTKAFSPHPPSA